LEALDNLADRDDCLFCRKRCAAPVTPRSVLQKDTTHRMARHARRPAIGKRRIEHVDRGARPASGCLDPDFCRSIGVV
jgi:hypothetical protein